MRMRALLLAGMASLIAAAPARAATITVTGTDDGAGSCSSSTSCPTLRAAVGQANSTTAADTIRLSAATYTVSAGELAISTPVTVSGASAATTTISQTGTSRIFNVTTGGNLTVQHATLTGGVSSSSPGGNVIVGNGNQLTLNHVRVTGGSATTGGGIAIGGAATATISHSSIDGNAATGGQAGGVLMVGNAKLAASTLTITDSTIANNTASTSAGIVVTSDSRSVTKLTRSTVASNSAGSNDGGPGIYDADGSSFTVTESIIFGNTGDGVPLNCGGTLTSGGGNVDSGSSCGLAGTGDVQNTDPGLGPLTGGIGETPVMPITSLSPAVDRVPIGAAACTGTDQRDLPRPQGGGCDSGAYEVDQAPDTKIDSGPSGTITVSSATFAFSSNEPGVTFQCQLDSSTFAACASPKSYSGLAEGAHTFSVRAVDGTGHTDGTPASRSFTVDLPPNTTITSGPTGPTNNASPSFTFSADQTGSTFQCKLDGPGATTGSFAACTSPKSYSGLADGAYTFSVRAIDPGGNFDATPATRSFTVDTVAPAVSITSGPSGPTNNSSPSFGFTAESGATLQCSLDGAAFTACASPKAYSGLADGAHTFTVRATDAAGNSATASRNFSVDTVPPVVTLSGTSGTIATSSASFTFTTTEGTLQCSLDGGAFAACTSPKSYSGLADGGHTFTVRATDAANNVGTASRSFIVDTTAPVVTLSGTSGTIATSAASFTFTTNEGTLQCKLDGPGATTGSFTACTSPKSYSGLADGGYTFTVRATDAAGNTGTKTRTFTVDTGAPVATINSGPSGLIATRSATFAFSSESGATFQCSLDGGGFTACTSPKTYTGLVDGAHTFSVHAVDAAHNVGPSASRSFTVDATAPQPPTFTSPPDKTLQRTHLIALAGHAEPGSTVEVFEGAAARGTTHAGSSGTWALSFTAPDGSHAYTARATDAAGNRSGPSAARTIRVDTTPPPADVTGGPSGSTSDRSPTFAFSSSDPGATFECRLDGPGSAVGTFRACSGSQTFSALAPGSYVFRLRARDAAGNTTETSRAFTITATPKPKPQKTVVVDPVRGQTLIKLPGTKKFVPLDVTKGIPLGSTVDTRHSRIRLSALRGPGDPLETALFYGGIFKVTQTKAVTQLRLVQPLACKATGKKASAARRRRAHRRHVWGSGKGRFRTRGQFSAATVLGTKWLTQDTCAKTLTRVVHGVVSVRDLVRHKTVKVRGGHSYTARKR